MNYMKSLCTFSSFRLHYKLTTGLLLGCSLLVTAVQLVTDPITCDVKVQFIHNLLVGWSEISNICSPTLYDYLFQL